MPKCVTVTHILSSKKKDRKRLKNACITSYLVQYLKYIGVKMEYTYYRSVGLVEAYHTVASGMVQMRHFSGSKDSTCSHCGDMSFFFNRPVRVSSAREYVVKITTPSPLDSGVMSYIVRDGDHRREMQIDEYYLYDSALVISIDVYRINDVNCDELIEMFEECRDLEYLCICDYVDNYFIKSLNFSEGPVFIQNYDGSEMEVSVEDIDRIVVKLYALNSTKIIDVMYI